MNIEELARIIYDANRAWCELRGDFSFTHYESAPAWQKDTIISGIRWFISRNVRPVPPSASHENWLKDKEADGWKYGPVKDADKKEHPCMVPYDELPADQRLKDHIFGAIVSALEPFLCTCGPNDGCSNCPKT
jgi:hypothetical protein